VAGGRSGRLPGHGAHVDAVQRPLRRRLSAGARHQRVRHSRRDLRRTSRGLGRGRRPGPRRAGAEPRRCLYLVQLGDEPDAVGRAGGRSTLRRGGGRLRPGPAAGPAAAHAVVPVRAV